MDPLPTSIGGSSPPGILLDLHDSYRAKSLLSINRGGFKEPKVDFSTVEEDLSLKTKGREINVPVESEEILSLPDQEVSVEVYEYSDAEPPKYDEPQHTAAPLRNYYDVNLTVTPKIHARNHGRLEAIKIETPSPVPHPSQSEGPGRS